MSKMSEKDMGKEVKEQTVDICEMFAHMWQQPIVYDVHSPEFLRET